MEVAFGDRKIRWYISMMRLTNMRMCTNDRPSGAGHVRRMNRSRDGCFSCGTSRGYRGGRLNGSHHGGDVVWAGQPPRIQISWLPRAQLSLSKELFQLNHRLLPRPFWQSNTISSRLHETIFTLDFFHFRTVLIPPDRFNRTVFCTWSDCSFFFPFFLHTLSRNTDFSLSFLIYTVRAIHFSLAILSIFFFS